jgi:hypothetical protein
MNEAPEKIELQTSTDNSIVHTIAKLISVLFHPLFVPIYFVWFLLFIHPLAFIGFSAMQKFQTLVIVGINLTIFPLVSVLLLKALGFIDSIYDISLLLDEPPSGGAIATSMKEYMIQNGLVLQGMDVPSSRPVGLSILE